MYLSVAVKLLPIRCTLTMNPEELRIDRLVRENARLKRELDILNKTPQGLQDYQNLSKGGKAGRIARSKRFLIKKLKQSPAPIRSATVICNFLL